MFVYNKLGDIMSTKNAISPSVCPAVRTTDVRYRSMKPTRMPAPGESNFCPQTAPLEPESGVSHKLKLYPGRFRPWGTSKDGRPNASTSLPVLF